MSRKRWMALVLAMIMVITSMPTATFANEIPVVASAEKTTGESGGTPGLTIEPTGEAAAEPTTEPEGGGGTVPTGEPTDEPPAKPTTEPTAEPTEEPTAEPTGDPTVEPTKELTEEPTGEPEENKILTEMPEETDMEGITATVPADAVTAHEFRKIWNDNHSEAKRPGEAPLELTYMIQGTDGTYYVLNEERTGLLPVEHAADAVKKVDAADALCKAIFPEGQVPDLPAHAPDGIGKWLYRLDLPGKVSLSFDGKTSAEYTITYGIRETAAVPGYVFAPEGDNLNDGTKTVLTNTEEEKFEATIAWQDAENGYNTRPYTKEELEGNLVLYRYVAGNPNTGEEVRVDGRLPLTATEGEDGSWNLSAHDLPAYDVNGNPYVYYVQQKTTEDGSQELPLENHDGDKYTYIYDNAGTEYSTEKNCLYNGGKLVNTLTNTRGYAVKKVWDDAETLENGANRPNCELRLYRVAAEIDEEGNIVYNPQHGSPVAGFDRQDVPALDASGEPYPVDEEIPVVFADGTASKLPKYDAKGKLYVYFAVENGLSGDYQMVIESGKGDRNYIAEDEDGNSLENYCVLDGDTLINRLVEQETIGLTKTFTGNSMQSIDSEQTRATFKLQISRDHEKTWEDYQENNKTVTKTLGIAQAGGNGKEVFRPEDPSVTDSSITMPKYDDEGHELHYRWVEVSMKVNGAESAFSSEGYEEGAVVNVDQGAEGKKDYVGPGVGNDGTTAQYEVTYQHDGSHTIVTNRLVGEAQFKVTKYWNGETGPEADSEGIKEVTFNLYRDGEPYRDEFGKPVTVTVKQEDDWSKIVKNLPRYDEEGNEYVYTVSENSIPGQNPEKPWRSEELFYKKTVVTDDYGNRIVQTEAAIDNVNEPGSTLIFDVEKVWLDDEDLLSRRDVKAALYRKNSDGNWIFVDEADLNESNLYRTILRYDGETMEDIDASQFVVIETEVGGVPVENILSEDEILEKAIEVPGVLENSHTVNETKGYACGTLGVLEENETDEKLNNQYYVYVGRGEISDNTDEDGNRTQRVNYTIYNQRFGTEDLELTKNWMAGGEALEATFEFFRLDEPETVLGTFTLGGNESERDSIGALAESEITDPDVKIQSTEIMTDENDSNHKYQTVTITGLPKYDAAGVQLGYGVRETAINGVPVENGGITQVNGDIYISYVGFEYADYAGELKHRTVDKFYWEGNNVRQESYNLTVNKVWQDDGTVENELARPDIRFTVYRATAPQIQSIVGVDPESSKGKTIQELTREVVEKVKSISEEHAADLVNASERVSVENKWDTRHNDWYWSCDLGEVPRYDAQGNPYIYFLAETVIANAAEYRTLYYNGSDRPNANNKDGNAVKSTAEVFEHPCGTPDGPDGNYGNILIISDGLSDGMAGSHYDPNKYSCTTVNYRQKPMIIQGKKLWSFPSGLILPDSELPELRIHAYRSSEKLEEREPEPEINYGYLKTEAAKNDGVVKEVNDITLNANGDGKFTFSFATDKSSGSQLQYYDSYGQSYYFYVEEEDIQGYPQLQMTANSFTLVNVYQPTPPYVQIKVSKTWGRDDESGEAGDLDVEATFELWAQCQDKEDGTGDPVGKALKAAEGKLEANNNGTKQELVFDKYTLGEYEGEHLPYYGPNGKPYQYFVKEIVPGGYVATWKYTTVAGTDIDQALTDGKEGEASTDPIQLTSVTPGDQIGYEGIVEVTDTYTGSTTTYAVQKEWAADNTDWIQNMYRPSKLLITLYRKHEGAEDSEKEDVATHIINSTENWKYTFSNEGEDNKGKVLDKYAPDGTAYIYWAEESLPENASVEDKSKFDSYMQGKDESGKIKNTLPTTGVYIDKKWMMDVNGTPAEMTEEQMKLLYALGAFPDSITFQVQRWNDAADAASSGWVNVPNVSCTYTLNSWDAVKNMLTHIKNTLHWTTLPKYKVGFTAPGDNGENLIKYRVTESVMKGGSSWVMPGGTGEDDSIQNSPMQNGSWTTGSVAVPGDNRTTFTFTNTLPVREACIDKIWDDGNNQDGLRPGSLDFTLKRDSDKQVTITLPMDADHQMEKEADKKDVNHYTTGVFYVPLYKDNMNGTASDPYSHYAADEILTTGVYDISKTYDRVTEGDDLADKHTANDPLKDENNNYNYFTFKNAQKARLTYSASAEKEWVNDTEWWDFNGGIRPTTVYLKLQYRYSGTEAWNDADTECGLSEGQDATQELTPAANWKSAEWTVYRYKTGGDGNGHQVAIQYRIIETDANGVQIENSFAYRVTGGINWAEPDKSEEPDEPENIFDQDTATAVTNTLKRLSIILKKQWADQNGTSLDPATIGQLQTAGALPSELKFTLQYQYEGMEEPQNVGTAGQTAYERIYDYNNAELLSTQGVTAWTGLPAYMWDDTDKEWKAVTYSVKESVRYANSTTFIDVDSNTNLTTVVTPGTPPDVSAADGTENVTVSNKIELGSLAVKKIWADENNRDGKRQNVTLRLKRDGVTYGADVVLDGTQTDADGNWTYTWTHLPIYRNVIAPAIALSARVKSVYSVVEIVNGQEIANGGLGNGYTTTYSQSVSLDETIPPTVTVTNTYAPEKFDVQARKRFDSGIGNDDWFEQTKPEKVYLTLQYKNSSNTWVNVTKADPANGYGDGTGVYTTSDVTQAIAVGTDKTTVPAEWKDLRHYHQVNGTATEIVYRVVESDKDGVYLSEIPAYNQNENSTGFVYGWDEDLLPGEEDCQLVVNTLKKETLTIEKQWNDTAGGVDHSALRPTSITFGVQYRVGTSAWADSKNDVTLTGDDLASDNANLWRKSIEVPLENADRTEYQYRVYEKSAVYAKTAYDAVPVTETGYTDGWKNTTADTTSEWKGSLQGYTSTVTTVKNAGTPASWKATAVNTLITGSLQVTKIWNDDDNRDGLRADTITVSLYRDPKTSDSVNNIQNTGTLVSSRTLTATDGTWTSENSKATWANLPLYKNDGTKSKYYVVETGIDGYTAAYSAGELSSADPDGAVIDAGNELTANDTVKETITNTHNPYRFNIEAEKNWSDYENRNQIRPTEITLTLQYRDPAVTDENAAEAWKTVPEYDGTQNPVSGVTPILAENISNPQTIRGSETEQWTAKASWNVPVYCYDTASKTANPLRYRVVENSVASYETKYTLNGEESAAPPEITGPTSAPQTETTVGVTVTNTLTETKLTVTKAWTDDSDNAYSTRPDSIIVKLQRATDSRLADNTITDKWEDVTPPGSVSTDPVPSNNIWEVSLSKTDNWAAKIFEHLPVYADAANTDKYKYRAVETALVYGTGADAVTKPVTPAGTEESGTSGTYIISSETTEDLQKNEFTANLTNRMASGSIKVTKTWHDGNNRDDKRPDDITVTLYRDPTGTLTSGAAPDEDWIKTGQSMGSKTLTPTGSQWPEAVWTGLPLKKSDGTPSRYYVIETAADGYTTVYDAAVIDSGKELQADPAAALTTTAITNTCDPKTFRITATKEWADPEGDDHGHGLRPESVELELITKTAGADGKPLQVVHKDAKPSPEADTGDVVYTTSDVKQTVSASKNWQAVWNDLPARVLVNGQSVQVEYSIKENNLSDSYTMNITSSITSDGSQNRDEIVVTNYLTGSVVLDVQKKWFPSEEMAAALHALPERILVQLQYRTKDSSNKAWNPVPVSNGAAEYVTAYLTAANNWHTLFTNLQKDYEYRAVELSMDYLADGETVTVPVNAQDTADVNTAVSAEDAVMIDGQTGEAGSFDYTGETIYTETEGAGRYDTTLTNALPETSLHVTKAWDDDDNRDGLRGPVVLELYRDGQFLDSVTLDGKPDAADEPGAPDEGDGAEGTDSSNDTEASAGAAWTGTETDEWLAVWNHLPLYKNGSITELSDYTVKETQINGQDVDDTAYSWHVVYGDEEHPQSSMTIPSKDGSASAILTNSHDPDTFTILAEKKWNDYDNINGFRPKEIVLKLQYRDPAAADDDAEDAWKDVPTRPTTEAVGGVTPILAVRQMNPQTIEGPEFTAKASWTVPCHYNDGDEIKNLQYRVVEDSVTSCTTEITPETITGADAEEIIEVTVTNTLAETKLTVTKAWDDEEDAYAARPENIIVKLQRTTGEKLAESSLTDDEKWEDVQLLISDGKETAEKPAAVTLTKEDNWAAKTFDHLPVYADADNTVPYIYRAVETGMDSGTYEVHADTLTTLMDGQINIFETNLLNVLKTTELTADKKWDDCDNYYGTRPQSDLTVKLQRRTGDGEWTDTAYKGSTAQTELIYHADTKTWKTAEFEGLPMCDSEGQNYEYRAVEVTEVPGYVSSTENDENGHSLITNTLETVKLTGTKKWDDKNNRYNKRPDSITLTVKDANGVVVPQSEITWKKDGNIWSFQLEGLPKYLPGTDTVAVYELSESAVENYKAKQETIIAEDGTADFVNVLDLPEDPQKTTDKPKTGDTSRPDQAVFGLGLSGVMMMILGMMRKKQKKIKEA